MSTVICLFMLVMLSCMPAITTPQYNLSGKGEYVRRSVKSGFIIIAFIAMIVVHCCRIGFVDTTTYMNIYRNIGVDKSLVFGGDLRIEIGFRLLCYILNFISDDPRILLVFVAAVVIIPFYRFIKKYSDNDGFSTILFLCTIFLYTMNTMRQYIVVGIFVMAYPLLREKKWIRYALVVLLASAFHTSAIIAGIILALCSGTIFNKRIKLLTVALLIVAFLPTEGFLRLLDSGVGDYGDVYDMLNKGGVNVLRLLVQAVPVVLAILYINMNKLKAKDLPKDVSFFTNMSIVSLLIYILALRSNYIARFALYFDFASVITIPYFLSRIIKKEDITLAYLITSGLYAVYFFFAARGFGDSIEMLKPFFIGG